MLRATFLIWVVFLLAACENPPQNPSFQIPENGISIKLEQRNSSTITLVPSELRIEIGDITRGQTLLTVWSGAEVILRESIRENESFPFGWNGQKLSVECVQLDNELLGPDFGYFKIVSTDSTSAKEATGISEKDKIMTLIDLTSKSDIVFIRNGTEHTGAEAADHLRRKYKQSEDEIHTVEEFITALASRSSTTNEPYQVRLKDGTTMAAEAWFRERLAEIDAPSAH